MPASQNDALQPPQVPACMLPGSMKYNSMGRHDNEPCRLRACAQPDILLPFLQRLECLWEHSCWHPSTRCM